MDPEVLRILAYTRGAERLIIQCGAIACIACGTLLFRWGVRGVTDTTTKLGIFELTLSRAAPGTVLALFGMGVMLWGVQGRLELDDFDRKTPRKVEQIADETKGGTRRGFNFRYADQQTETQQILDQIATTEIPAADTQAVNILADLRKRARTQGCPSMRQLVCDLAAAKPESDAKAQLSALKDRLAAADCKPWVTP